MTAATDTPPTITQAVADAKAEAETVAAMAQARRFDAEAAHFAALTVKTNVEAAQADLVRESTRIETEAAQRVELTHLADDYYMRVYRFTTDVSAASSAKCMNTLAQWSRVDPACNIEIVFNSPGGSVVDGMALFDFIQDIRDKGHHVTTSCLGMAASMAGILLQAGDKRTMGRQSWLMIHEASFGAGGKIGEVEDTVEWVKKVQGRILDIFADRCKMTREEIADKWERRDWWLSSDYALELGFIDEIRRGI